jgi:branched-chain amino acid transport system permease protein
VLNQLIFGTLIVLFLVFEPLGLSGIWSRLRTYIRTWPFSY